MKKLLLFLSKTDIDIYNECPKSAKNTQLAFGLFVLLTGILAFCSGTYAILNMFTDFDWETKKVSFSNSGYMFAPILGAFYALMIIAIDREVVAAKNKTTAFSRLLLAIVIGVIVAVPIELKLLEGKIEKKLIENYKLENKDESDKMRQGTNELKSKRNRLQNAIDNYQKEIDRWSEIMEQEVTGKVAAGRTNKAGEGPAYREAKRNMDLNIENKKEAQIRYNEFMNNEYKTDMTEIENTFKNQQIVQQFDLLSKFQALHEVIEDDKTGSTWWMSWGIRVLFVLFEIIPSLIKLMTSSSEYDALLEARRRMNIQLAYAFANKILSDLELPKNVKKMMDNQEDIPLPYMDEIKQRIMT